MPDLGEVSGPIIAVVVLLQAVVWAVMKLRDKKPEVKKESVLIPSIADTSGSFEPVPDSPDWAKLQQLLEARMEAEPATQRDVQELSSKVDSIVVTLDDHVASEDSLAKKIDAHVEEDRENFLKLFDRITQ